MKDEALKLALEALLWANNEINEWRDDAHGYEPEDQPVIMSAVTACEQALAAPVQKPVAWMSKHAVGFKKSEFGATPTVPLYTAAQPAPTVQEPEWKQIAEDLRFHGLTLVKTATGYAVLKLGAVHAQATPPAQPAPVQEPMAHIVGEIDHTGKVWKPANPAVPDEITDRSESPEYRSGWNDCRQTMLEMRKP
jgi:hypothetical protein